jgi:hypothetical protein
LFDGNQLNNCFLQENAALDTPLTNVADDLKSMTVVEVEDLVPRNVAVIRPRAADPRHVGTNFKKFRKVWYFNILNVQSPLFNVQYFMKK